MNKLKILFASLLIVATPRAFALTPNVDLRDVIRYGAAKEKTEARALVNLVNKSPLKFGLPEGITYENDVLTAVAQFTISTIEVQNASAEGADIYVVYSPAEQNQILLNRVSIDAKGRVREIAKFDLSRDLPTAQIDILNRQMTLAEGKSGFLKVMPVSLGSLVNLRLGDATSGYRSLSAPFARAVLNRSQSELSRTEPDYYKGRPFLRIMDLNQKEYRGFTPFGIHYQIGEVFQRGFISNGCFRLRDTDLYELSTVVFLSRTGNVPFSVVESAEGGNLHPFPMINNWFFMPRIAKDQSGKMDFLKDEHGLYVFDKKVGQAQALLQATMQVSPQTAPQP